MLPDDVGAMVDELIEAAYTDGAACEGVTPATAELALRLLAALAAPPAEPAPLPPLPAADALVAALARVSRTAEQYACSPYHVAQLRWLDAIDALRTAILTHGAAERSAAREAALAEVDAACEAFAREGRHVELVGLDGGDAWAVVTPVSTSDDALASDGPTPTAAILSAAADAARKGEADDE